MPFSRRVPQALDDEHHRQLALLDRFERALTRGHDADLATLAAPMQRHIDGEIAHHFGFEEDELFPRVRDAGGGDIVALLAQEHADIRELCAELRPLVHALAHGALTVDQRPTFRQLALELVERMVAHIQKETMGLLPLLDDLLDEPTDEALALGYASA